MHTRDSRYKELSLLVLQSRFVYSHSFHLSGPTRQGVPAEEDTNFPAPVSLRAEPSRRCGVCCISSEAEIDEYICERMMEVDTEGATSERPQGAVIGRVRLINTGTYAIFCSVLYRLEKRKPRNLTWICILGNRSQEGISTPVRVVNLEIGRYDLQQYGSK